VTMAHRAVLAHPSIGLFLDHRPTGPGTCPRHARAVYELCISGINNSIRIVGGDVALRQLDGHSTGKPTLEQHLAHVRIVLVQGTKSGRGIRPPALTNLVLFPGFSYLAFATTAAKACGSLTAISASTFRFRPISAFFMAATRRL
jgi:hypothetical protein